MLRPGGNLQIGRSSTVCGATIITLWGLAHLVPTGAVVRGFGSISEDNRRIITMEWIAEGATLCFIGLLVLSVTLGGTIYNPVSVNVIRASGVMLIAMALLTLSTGARTSVLPIKICPFVKTACAVLFLLGSSL